jgi:hypothetical protein
MYDHLRRSDRNDCATVITDHNMCWNNRGCVARAKDHSCHTADDEDELQSTERQTAEYNKCAQEGLTYATCGAKFETLVVTHDRKFMDSGLTAGAFHCVRDARAAGGCKCKCDHHPACCAHKNKLVSSSSGPRGNRFQGIATLQDCCNMCTNHPSCSTWEYDSDKVCMLKSGAATFVAAPPTSAGYTTWAGLPSHLGGC